MSPDVFWECHNGISSLLLPKNWVSPILLPLPSTGIFFKEEEILVCSSIPKLGIWGMFPQEL